MNNTEKCIIALMLVLITTVAAIIFVTVSVRWYIRRRRMKIVTLLTEAMARLESRMITDGYLVNINAFRDRARGAVIATIFHHRRHERGEKPSLVPYNKLVDFL